MASRMGDLRPAFLTAVRSKARFPNRRTFEEPEPPTSSDGCHARRGSDADATTSALLAWASAPQRRPLTLRRSLRRQRWRTGRPIG